MNEEELQSEVNEFQKAKKKKDDMRDLFEVKRDDVLDTEDVVGVDMEKDIMDADEEHPLSDVTEVSEEDIMGNVYGQSPLEGAGTRRAKKKKMSQPHPQSIIYPYTMGGLNR